MGYVSRWVRQCQIILCKPYLGATLIGTQRVKILVKMGIKTKVEGKRRFWDNFGAIFLLCMRDEENDDVINFRWKQ